MGVYTQTFYMCLLFERSYQNCLCDIVYSNRNILVAFEISILPHKVQISNTSQNNFSIFLVITIRYSSYVISRNYSFFV
jgi:hypothetical protein